MNTFLGNVKQSPAYLRNSFKSWHGRFVLAGLTVGLIYFPIWLFHLGTRTLQGSGAMPLILGCVAMGLWQLWKSRQAIVQLQVSESDEFLGHLLILCSVVLFPFCSFAVWAQSILWFCALSGIVISTWGIVFFKHFPLPSLLIAVTVYPKPGILARVLWETLTPHDYLNRFMAWSGAFGLRLIGLPAISEGSLVVLPPEGSVHVDWGCNGFSMACTMAATGFFLGILLKQRGPTVFIMTIVGAVMALIFNIPRIMLLTVASIHWGEASFNFWHGTWGGQIFSGALFTVYYYAVMAIIKHRSRKLA
ncbi:cyanoexosortase C [Pseudanabaena sp. FACHB-2040]|uniref:cyanoexosortase C n=1 Tax=Pseudanabaena sp. FACHB-2040 TaxID=2692859 RepID=UPI0016825658|nr:cyanoexosortase C [Pseudanabaena sp. FACHB-2040]MBD2260590.1 cyanoexosortase C [Pseudanabaena sp. FACHB-2040]